MTAVLRSLQINPGFFTELRCDPAIGAVVKEAAAAGAAAAKTFAPVGDASDPHYTWAAAHGLKGTPGGYAASIYSQARIVNYPGIGRTWVGRVASNNFKAGWIERGGASFTTPLAPLRRGVEAGANLQVQVVP